MPKDHELNAEGILDGGELSRSIAELLGMFSCEDLRRILPQPKPKPLPIDEALASVAALVDAAHLTPTERRTLERLSATLDLQEIELRFLRRKLYESQEATA